MSCYTDRLLANQVAEKPIRTSCHIINEYTHFVSPKHSIDEFQSPINAGKMADYETLTLCVFPNSSQMCTYFCKDLVIGYCLYLAKIRFPTIIRFYYSHLVAMGLMSREIRVYCLFYSLAFALSFACF